MRRLTVGISIDGEMLAKIDSKRGLIPRSRYIENLLLKALE